MESIRHYNPLCSAGLITILVLGVMSPLVGTALANGKDITRSVEGEKISISNEAITVVVVAGGKHPEFFWFANKDKDSKYRVKFKGLVEYLDFGQKVFQRKFKAELNDYIQDMKKDTRPVDAGKSGSSVTVFGAIKENRERDTSKIFNYVVGRGKEEIGVNVTKATKVLGELKGEAFVTGIVRTSGRAVYLEAKSVTSGKEVDRELKERSHPAFFEFNDGRWNFTGFQPIKSRDKVIGYQFSFILKGVKNPHFKDLEDQIIIRSRIYNATVKEKDLTVTSANIKTDFIVRSWKWNLNSTLADVLGLDLTKDKLALWLELTMFSTDKLEDAVEGKVRPSMTHVKSEDESIDARPHGEARGEDEKELKMKAKDVEHKLGFVRDAKVLGGYFNFTNFAFVYPKGSSPAKGEKVPVTASYLSEEQKLRLYVIYPNFGAKSLEHDPTMGVETEGIPSAPQFTVFEGEGAEPIPVTTVTATSTRTVTQRETIPGPISTVTQTHTVRQTQTQTQTTTLTQTQSIVTTSPTTITATTTITRPSPEQGIVTTQTAAVTLPLIIIIVVLGILLVRRKAPRSVS